MVDLNENNEVLKLNNYHIRVRFHFKVVVVNVKEKDHKIESLVLLLPSRQDFI